MDSTNAKRYWLKFTHALHWDELSPIVRRTIVAVIGGTVLLIGIAMVILPGPAFVVIPLGLAILASEFAWARHAVRKARGLLKRTKRKAAA